MADIFKFQLAYIFEYVTKDKLLISLEDNTKFHEDLKSKGKEIWDDTFLIPAANYINDLVKRDYKVHISLDYVHNIAGACQGLVDETKTLNSKLAMGRILCVSIIWLMNAPKDESKSHLCDSKFKSERRDLTVNPLLEHLSSSVSRSHLVNTFADPGKWFNPPLSVFEAIQVNINYVISNILGSK